MGGVVGPGRGSGWRRSNGSAGQQVSARAARVSAYYQWPRWTTLLNGRRSGLRIGASGRSAG